MKKILLSLMLFAAVSKAQTVNLDLTYTASPIGQASQVAAQVYGIDTTLTYTAQTSRQIGAIGDALKVTLAGGSVTVTGGTFVLTSNTAVAQGAAGSAPWPVYLSPSVYTYVSRTPELVTTAGLAVNISTVAGVSCNDCRVYWSTRDANGIYWDLGNSSTVPAALTLGHYTAASVTATLDDGFADGEHIYFAPWDGASKTVFLTVRKKR